MPLDDAALLRACETLEECYEFTLAYAAQGHGAQADEAGSPAESAAHAQVRDRLTRAAAVAADLAQADAARWGAFAAVLARDADAARAVLELALAQPAVSSAMMDSLNASLHLRALLADVFLLAEILESRQAAATPAAP